MDDNSLTYFQRKVVNGLWRRYTHANNEQKVRLFEFGVLALAFVIALVGAIGATLEFSRYALFLIGVVAGAFFALAGQIRKSRLIWPLSKEIIDWRKVEQLASQAKSQSFKSHILVSVRRRLKIAWTVFFAVLTAMICYAWVRS